MSALAADCANVFPGTMPSPAASPLDGSGLKNGRDFGLNMGRDSEGDREGNVPDFARFLRRQTTASTEPENTALFKPVITSIRNHHKPPSYGDLPPVYPPTFTREF